MLDVHILTLPETNDGWLDRAAASVEAAAALAPIKVNLYVVESSYGNLGKSRELGYSQGTGDYVTYVDDDDWIDPSAFIEIGRALLEGPQRVTAGEYVFMGNRWDARPEARHHLACYRRDWLSTKDFASFRLNPDTYLMHSSAGPHISKCLYYYNRRSDSPGSRLLGSNPLALSREANRILQETKQHG